MDTASLQNFLGLVVIFAPLLLLLLLGLPALFAVKLNEQSVAHLTKLLVSLGLIANLGILGTMLATGTRDIEIEAGQLASITPEHFHFHLKFEFDRLSVPMSLLSYVLCGTIGAFANVYLHRDQGYRRFFILFAMFLLGMVFASLAGTIETLFVGWELVGLSSALLVAYFHDRPAPVRNGLRIWAVYRIADAAFLVAAVALHHLTGEGDFAKLMGQDHWPTGHVELTSNEALFVGSLLLLAAAGKSALVPFSGWLPRAMEGPTPSSAVFYGALSVHLGAFLLLRVSPLLEASFILSAMVVALGLTTALYASWTSSVQTDVKSALAMASLTQVGIIVAEIGLGFHYLALIHIVGHACMRSLQLLRAPTLLRDYRALENAIGSRLDLAPPRVFQGWSSAGQLKAYRFFMERGYLDALLDSMIVHPFRRCFGQFDRWERAWTDWLSGKQSRESETIVPHVEPAEDLV
ncbi:MAG: oxidoreductase [Pirellulaceae bacterium]|nr:oxidoreductase [Pirellulaceae bacterium]